MSTSKLGIVTDRSTGDQVGEMQPMDRDQAQTLKKAAQRSGKSVDVKDISGNNLAEEMSPEDGRNVAMDIARCLRDALREHGDEIKAIYLANSTNQGVTIKIQYMPDENSQAEEDEFVFRWPDGVLRLDNVANPVELCKLQKQSGTVILQKDLVKANLLKFFQSHDNVEQPSQEVDPNALPDGPVAEEQLWESEECQEAFCNAITNFRNNAKDREAIKALIKAARPFQKGDTIQEKFKGAVDWYNIYRENPPKNTQKQVFLENQSSLDAIVEKLRDALQAFKSYVNTSEDLHAGAYYRDLIDSFLRFYRYYQTTFGPREDLEELFDSTFGDPAYGYERQEMLPNDNFDQEEEDEPVTNEADEYGPEVGDNVDYEGGHYKLYGYCGYEVVLQNVDDERDFKVVTPEAAGIKKPEGNLKESTTWVDPDNM